MVVLPTTGFWNGLGWRAFVKYKSPQMAKLREYIFFLILDLKDNKFYFYFKLFRFFILSCFYFYRFSQIFFSFDFFFLNIWFLGFALIVWGLFGFFFFFNFKLLKSLPKMAQNKQKQQKSIFFLKGHKSLGQSPPQDLEVSSCSGP